MASLSWSDPGVPPIQRRTRCRGCLGDDLEPVLSLGSTPLANAFLQAADLARPEARYPLELIFCRRCALVQLAHVVAPEILFRDYVYVSSTSPAFVAHFERFAAAVCDRLQLEHNSLVVDIGSNDGILLRPYLGRAMRVLGVDPARRIALQASRSGVETIPEFWSTAIAEQIVHTHGTAAVVTATSVFPHVDDLDGFVDAVRRLLADDGVFIIEAYALGDLLEQNLFDTIYHEHLSYFSLRTIVSTLARLGLQVFDAQHVATHGGSLRVMAQKIGGPHARQPGLQLLLDDESRLRLDDVATYTAFARRIEENRDRLQDLLRSLKAQGDRIAGYGAPAKGNTLLNYFGIGREILDYVVDDSPWKQGLYTPGTRLPVVPPERLHLDPPRDLLILAWNFAEPIMQKCDAFRAAGGRFIIPVPVPRVL